MFENYYKEKGKHTNGNHATEVLLIFLRSSEEKDTCLQLRRKIIRDLSPSSSKSNNPMLQRKKRMFGDVSKDSFIFSGSREVMEICFEQIC